MLFTYLVRVAIHAGLAPNYLSLCVGLGETGRGRVTRRGLRRVSASAAARWASDKAVGTTRSTTCGDDCAAGARLDGTDDVAPWRQAHNAVQLSVRRSAAIAMSGSVVRESVFGALERRAHRVSRRCDGSQAECERDKVDGMRMLGRCWAGVLGGSSIGMGLPCCRMRWEVLKREKQHSAGSGPPQNATVTGLAEHCVQTGKANLGEWSLRDGPPLITYSIPPPCM